jgi:hypothetical protein
LIEGTKRKFKTTVRFYIQVKIQMGNLMNRSHKSYYTSHLARFFSLLPLAWGESENDPSVLWKRNPDWEVEYCINWSTGTGTTLLTVSQYVTLQTHTMLPAPNSRGAHGLSALTESNTAKQHGKSCGHICEACISVFILHKGKRSSFKFKCSPPTFNHIPFQGTLNGVH